MSLKSEGDAEEHILEKEDEYDYTVFSRRCGGCGVYSAELTSMEKQIGRASCWERV
jgi:hypothetical protein